MNCFAKTDEFPVAASNSDDVHGDDVVTVSSGNVFADLGIDNPAEAALKADLVMLIQDQIERLELKQTEAAKLMGIGQPDVSKLLRGRTSGYSLERVFAFVRALGGDVDISVKAKPEATGGRMRLHVELEPA
ncbi:helix-turn-helix domain-containing protein [Methylobacterium radiotolerans]|uniref:helix-turn-helix domain-containing protein n=1 Tax=Methylobacterium radiotolerans TaxID=31998 RepID=UPI0009D6F241|nr:helix-turn-helix transcriptional regulator [Methylobacterium radiotolerans]GEN01293.1 hypothetical protein MRA01_58320 [Methylobacterium radiotolerans]